MTHEAFECPGEFIPRNIDGDDIMVVLDGTGGRWTWTWLEVKEAL